MRAFFALIRRERIEHRGAFLAMPLVLTGLVFGAILLGLWLGRVDRDVSSLMFSVAAVQLFERGFLLLGFAWALYLAATLLFYAAGSFAADQRNNAMLFWKSMPVSDLTMLASKMTAAFTAFPLIIYGFALASGALLAAIALVITAAVGFSPLTIASSLAGPFWQVAAAIALSYVVALGWYAPVVGLVGAMATVAGRWAVPIAAMTPLVVAVLEWITLGGLSPFHTRSWAYLSQRLEMPLAESYIEGWFLAEGVRFDLGAYAADLLAAVDWAQMAYGIGFALVALYLASEYRRRYVLT